MNQSPHSKSPRAIIASILWLTSAAALALLAAAWICTTIGGYSGWAPALVGGGLVAAATSLALCVAQSRITTLLQAQSRETDELRQQTTLANERYKLLTDNLAAAVIVRGAAGNIVYCSPYTEILTGYPVREMYAGDTDFFERIVHEGDRSKYIRSLQVTSHGEPFQFRYRFWHKTGLLMWAESRTVPILDDDGSVISSLSITLDVTGNVRYQRQVEEKNEELQDFTYMISHDLKSPIFTLKGMLGILQEELGASPREQIAEPLEHIGRAMRRLEQLVTSVLEYSRASSFEAKHERVDLGLLLPEVVSDFKPNLTGCAGVVSIAGTLPVVIGDTLRLTQVFSNLLSNAIKYRSPERALKVIIEAAPSLDPKMTAIAFRDNGLGIPPDKLEIIFRPFHRLHGAEIEGSGIGLACVKKLLERLGGSIAAESDGLTGSTFIVSLPSATL